MKQVITVEVIVEGNAYTSGIDVRSHIKDIVNDIESRIDMVRHDDMYRKIQIDWEEQEEANMLIILTKGEIK